MDAECPAEMGTEATKARGPAWDCTTKRGLGARTQAPSSPCPTSCVHVCTCARVCVHVRVCALCTQRPSDRSAWSGCPLRPQGPHGEGPHRPVFPKQSCGDTVGVVWCRMSPGQDGPSPTRVRATPGLPARTCKEKAVTALLCRGHPGGLLGRVGGANLRRRA